jgi:hypothetical protein
MQFLRLCIARDDTFAKKAGIIKEMHQIAYDSMIAALAGESARGDRRNIYIKTF